MTNTDGVEEEIERINKALGEESNYKCEDFVGSGNGYELEKKK